VSSNLTAAQLAAGTTTGSSSLTSVPGLASGINTAAIVSSLEYAQAANLRALLAQQTSAQNLQTTYNTLSTKLHTLLDAVNTLTDPNTLAATVATVSNPTVLSATTSAGSSQGVYDVNIIQSSTPSKLMGAQSISGGSLNLSNPLSSAGLTTAVAPSTGSFTINGASISYDTTADSVSSIIAKINNSAAGITATYDAGADRMILNSNGGGGAITVSDVTGNLAAALGLTAGFTMTAGQSAQVSINGGSPVSSSDNIFTTAETGIPGLSFTISQSSGSAQISLATDTASIKSSISSFVTAYNDVMNYISTNSAITTSSDGTTTTAGAFTYDSSVQSLASSLQQTLSQEVSGLPASLNNLAEMGIGTNTNVPSATISIFDATKLANALNNNLGTVKSLFSDVTNGVMSQLSSMVFAATTNSSGVIQSATSNITDQLSNLSSSIDSQTQYLNTYVDSLNAEFQNMESVIASYNSSGVSQILTSLMNMSSAITSTSSSSSTG